MRVSRDRASRERERGRRRAAAWERTAGWRRWRLKRASVFSATSRLETAGDVAFVGTPTGAMGVETGAAAKDGLRDYYRAKIEEYELAVRDKTQNLRRLEAQRNELNNKGASTGPRGLERVSQIWTSHAGEARRTRATRRERPPAAPKNRAGKVPRASRRVASRSNVPRAVRVARP